ncbi:folliculin-interacting protein middle domain-containing protein [Phycomyces nitens]|nr:folliculin-interacting protein middle domain-containing protein [Phycomyces nitens]
MLQRLFRSKAASRDNDDIYTQSLLESEPWAPIPLKEGHIRILFCQDAGESNKTVLYDSDLPPSLAQDARTPTEMARSWNGNQLQALTGRVNLEMDSLIGRRQDFKPHSLRATPSLSMHDQGASHQQRQANRRLDLIGDMIFGTAPLAYKGMNTKVHYKRDKDPQIVLSKLFTLHPRDSEGGRRTSFSSINSDRSTTSSRSGFYGDETKRSVSAMSMQSVSMEDTTSEQSSDDESRYSASIYPPILGLRTHSRRSFWSKRSRRFSQTTLENGTFRPMPLPSSRLSVPVRHASRSVKYALAIVITLEDKNKTLYDFVFSHFALIENRMHQLQTEAFRVLCSHFRSNLPSTVQVPTRKSKANPSYLSPNVFQNEPIMIEAVHQFKNAFYELYGTPRIQEPLWLNMSTFPQRKSDYSKSLIKELIHLINEFDNRAHNYLVSTMITAVLTYHLSWVNTVAPPENEANIGCHHGNYDPLWAQLSDMYGYVGTPSRITRTIVIGQKASTVRRILYILSYLIRCNEVYENFESLLDPEAVDLFGCERGGDESFALKLEDKIVRQLIGSSTDLESIAIPKTQRLDLQTYPTESPESMTTNSNSTSLSTTPNMYTPQWSSTDVFNGTKNTEKTWKHDEQNRVSANTDTDTQKISSEDQAKSLENPVVSPSGVYPVEMPRSSIFHMEPDITQVKDNGIPTDPADRLYAKSYGRSLMASYCEGYKSDFVLMGMPNTLSDVQLEQDMKMTLQQFSLSDSVTESACLVIDTSSSRCRVLHQQLSELDEHHINGTAEVVSNGWQNVRLSNLVFDLLADVKQKNDAGLSPDEIVELFEDGLQLIYFRSTLLQERVYECLETGALDSLKGSNALATDIG